MTGHSLEFFAVTVPFVETSCLEGPLVLQTVGSEESEQSEESEESFATLKAKRPDNVTVPCRSAPYSLSTLTGLS